jgi:hypothetical protein
MQAGDIEPLNELLALQGPSSAEAGSLIACASLMVGMKVELPVVTTNIQ